jgi:3-methyladenine DNA glycosylase AlkD
MDLQGVMRELEAAGTDSTRELFRRHGMPEPLFGVPFAKIGEIRRRLGTHHSLALALWATGNADARNLATRLANPGLMDEAALEAWAEEIRWYGQSDQVAGLAARSAAAARLRDRWIRSPKEWIARAGWSMVAHEALHAGEEPDAAFDGYLAAIEKGVHAAPNRARDAMLAALVAIGTRSDDLASRALAAAARIGPVAVDHGETGGRTPDPLAEIPRARDHHRRREDRDTARGRNRLPSAVRRTLRPR